MKRTENFRKQHQEMLQIAGEIAALLKAELLVNDANANQARKLLSALAGKLTVHLSMEDKALYPRLLQHKDDQIKKLAKEYMTEMGGLGDTFQEYNKRWSNAPTIQNRAAEFVNETGSVLQALAKRIEREDNELYEFFDKI